MTASYGDACPVCGSGDVTPWALIVGGTEQYGYQCLGCEVSWPVLSHRDGARAVARLTVARPAGNRK